MTIFLDETPPPNLANPDWPDGCVNRPAGYQKLGYLAWHRMADARVKRGEDQTYCRTCERFRWTSTPCDGIKKAQEASE
jgi:hypothetical protein